MDGTSAAFIIWPIHSDTTKPKDVFVSLALQVNYCSSINCFLAEKVPEVEKSLGIRSQLALKLKRKRNEKPSLSWAVVSFHPTSESIISIYTGSPSWTSPLTETRRRCSMASGHYGNLLPRTRRCTRYALVPVNIVTLASPMLLLTSRRDMQPPPPTGSFSQTKKSPAPSWLANCQRAPAGIAFTLKPQNSRAHSNNKGSARCCPIQENNFLGLNFTFCSESSPGMLLLFDSLENHTNGKQKRKYKPIVVLEQKDYSYLHSVNVRQETINS